MMEFEVNRELKDLTTFKIGGRAKFFVEVSSTEQAMRVVRFCQEKGMRYFVLGKGSNVLFDDRGFDGLVILNKIAFCKEEEEGVFHAGAGYSFSLLGAKTAKAGFAGLEFASGIPGSVGGAVYMNAGANGKETCETLQEVEFVDGEGQLRVLRREELDFGYRSSYFQRQGGVIVSAKFQLERSEEARQKQLQIIDYRTKTQPYGEPSAGCVFRNSVLPAGRLIEESGLKGMQVGGAQVSGLHANFIVNVGGATAADVLELAKKVQQEVKERKGVELEMEVRIVEFEI